MEDEQAGTSIRVLLRLYHNPGNAYAASYAYFTFNSLHRRLLTHSSTSEIWKEETSIFYYNLSSRGYPRRFLRTVFQEVTWA